MNAVASTGFRTARFVGKLQNVTAAGWFEQKRARICPQPMKEKAMGKKIHIAGLRLAHLRYVVYLNVEGVVYEVSTPLPDRLGLPEEWLLGSGEGTQKFGSLSKLLAELGVNPLLDQAVAYRLDQLSKLGLTELLNEWEKKPLEW